MPQFNPHKNKRRVANTTLLMFGEGLAEGLFLKHIRGLYSRNKGVSVKIRSGKGGDAVEIVNNAVKEPGDFDNKIVVIDNDKGDTEMGAARKQAAKHGIILLENCPCLESLLLSILRDGKSFADRESKWCKKEFESNYIDRKRRTEPKELDKMFPKELLDESRKKVEGLHKIIRYMEGLE